MQRDRGQKLSLGSLRRWNSEELQAGVTQHQWFYAVFHATPRCSSVQSKMQGRTCLIFCVCSQPDSILLLGSIGKDKDTERFSAFKDLTLLVPKQKCAGEMNFHLVILSNSGISNLLLHRARQEFGLWHCTVPITTAELCCGRRRAATGDT